MLENLDDESAARTEADVMVLTRRQDITGRGEWLMNIDFIAVAHRDHPLAALDGPLEDSALAPWPLVRIADQGGDSQAPRDAWTFSTIDAAIDAVMYQVGFGWLPEERIRPHLDQGVLKRLPLSHGAPRDAAASDRQAGPGADRRTGGHAAGVVPDALRGKAALVAWA